MKSEIIIEKTSIPLNSHSRISLDERVRFLKNLKNEIKLNEEYIYNHDGKLQNPGFLDYRIPVASDLPMIDPVILEIPNPGHPYGVRGVGETSIVPRLAAINTPVSRATGIRFTELPLSPPRVLKAILNKQ